MTDHNHDLKVTSKIEIDSMEFRHRLLNELTSHVGAANAIGMPALYQAVFERPWDDRINDTRRIRKLVQIMRMEGVPICSVSTKPGGYYLAAAGSELADYTRRYEGRALRILKTIAKIRKISLPNYLGQIKLDMEADNGKAA